MSTTDSGSQLVEALVKRHVSNAATVHNVGSDLVFCLPHLDDDGNHQRSKFALLFDELDAMMQRLGFSSYGISDTTMEEVSHASFRSSHRSEREVTWCYLFVSTDLPQGGKRSI